MPGGVFGRARPLEERDPAMHDGAGPCKTQERHPMPGRLSTAMVMATGLTFGLAGGAAAHTPIAACYEVGDGLVLCEGGYSDGASASGTPILVRSAAGKTLIEGTINDLGEFEFEKPDGFGDVLFDGGEGHRIVIPASEIY